MKRHKIQKYVKRLIGLQLSIARLAGSGRNFHFGVVKSHSKGSSGEYALHIQCAWRIEHSSKIVTGSHDIWWPYREIEGPKKWNYEDGNSIQDVQLYKLLEGYDPVTQSWINTTELLVVERIKVSRFGDLTLYLSGNYRLFLFVDQTRNESWRLFRTESNERHLVVGRKSIK